MRLQNVHWIGIGIKRVTVETPSKTVTEINFSGTDGITRSGELLALDEFPFLRLTPFDYQWIFCKIQYQ
jgi:hypothetical protein